MKEVLPCSLIGLVVCCAMALITYGAIILETPSEVPPHIAQMAQKSEPLTIGNWDLWYALEDELKHCVQLAKIQESQPPMTQIATVPQAYPVPIQKQPVNQNRKTEIENRIKEIDVLIAQKIEGKKADEIIVNKMKDEIAKKVSKGLPTGYNATDSMFYAPIIERVDSANAEISDLQEEKDRLNKELSNLR